MRSLRHSLTFAAALGLTVASLAHAQRPGAPRRPNATGTPNAAPNMPGQPAGPDAAGPRGPRGRGGMVAARGNPAARLLALRQQLELTDDQVKKLEALQAAPRPKSTASDQLRARADLMDAMQGDGNLTAARAALEKMNRIRTDEAITRLKTQQEVRAVLTAAQKAKLESFRGARGRDGMGRGRGGLRGGARGQGFGPGGRRGMMGGQPGFQPGRGMGQGFGPGMRGQGPNGPMPPIRGRRGVETDSTAGQR